MAAFALGLVGDPRAVDRLRGLAPGLGGHRARARGGGARAPRRRARGGRPRALRRRAGAQEPPRSITIRGDDPANPSRPLGGAAPRALRALPAQGRARGRGRPAPRGRRATLRLVGGGLRGRAARAPRCCKPMLVAAASSDRSPRPGPIAARGLGALKDPPRFDILATLVRDPDEMVSASARQGPGDPGRSRGAPRWRSPAGLAEPRPDARGPARPLASFPGDRSRRARGSFPSWGPRSPGSAVLPCAALARADPRRASRSCSPASTPTPTGRCAPTWPRLSATWDGELGASLLLTMLKDPDARVLPAVLEALRVARGPDAADTLSRHLEHPDSAVRVAAVEGLVALGAQGQGDALGAAYQRALPEAPTPTCASRWWPPSRRRRTGRAGPSWSKPRRAIPPGWCGCVRSLALRSAGGDATRVPDPDPKTCAAPSSTTGRPWPPTTRHPVSPLYSPRAILHTRPGTDRGPARRGGDASHHRSPSSTSPAAASTTGSPFTGSSRTS